tara:strand:+ start:29 stop:1207 length:1179 start_codon:yes stop_codon:yes gene_type:complete
MPHLIETYALNCGLKIDKPFLLEKYFPVEFDNYITFHPFSKYESKSYDYWQDVVDFIHPELQKNGIEILQIGAKDDTPFRKCKHTQGLTSLQQSAYLINHSKLHLGADSFATHVASGYGKKIVSLYSNTYANIARPYWTKEEDRILFEPDREKLKPSYSAVESPKSINQINPEDIANAVTKLLNINYKCPFKTLKKGENYNSKSLQLFPNCIINVDNANSNTVVVRMDYEFNEDVLVNQLAKSKCIIVTEKPITASILDNFGKNIQEVMYFINEDHNVNFVKYAQSKNINVKLLTKETDSSIIEKYKLYFMDYGIIDEVKIIKKEDLDLSTDKNLYYKTNLNLISSGKVYQSLASKNAEQPKDSLETQIQELPDTDAFWEESDKAIIFQKIS